MQNPKKNTKKPITKPSAPKKSAKWDYRKKYIFFLFAFSVLLYSNTLQNGFTMDDGAMVSDNKLVLKGFAGIPAVISHSSVFGATGENSVSYRPLTMTIFAIEVGFFGVKPFMFHLIHILLYGLSCIILFRVLERLLKDYNMMLPAAATLLFAAHPLHTEVAASIKSLDEILSLILGFSALYYMLGFIDTKKTNDLYLSCLYFAGALFSKESAVTFILLVPVAIFLFRKISIKDTLKTCLPLLIPIILYFLARAAVLSPPQPAYMPILNNTLTATDSFSIRLASIFFILFYYFRLLVFPTPLTWDYCYNQVPLTSFSNPLVIVSVVITLALIVFVILQLRKNPIISFSILQFFISLSVTLNIFMLFTTSGSKGFFASATPAAMAERYLFVPSIGFCLAVCYLLLRLFSIKFGSKDKVFIPSAPAVVLVIILVLFSGKTIARNFDWYSNITLFEAGVETSPNSYRANESYAYECLKQAELETDAISKKSYYVTSSKYYQIALTIYPYIGNDWYNYAVVNRNIPDSAKMLEGYKRALALNTEALNASYSVAQAYLQSSKPDSAIKYFKKTDSVQAGFMDVDFKIGLCYHYKNELLKAQPYYEAYYKANPQNHDVMNNLYLVYLNTGNIAKANELKAKMGDK